MIESYTLKNNNGMEMTVTNVGCAIMTLIVPDKNGKPVDVVLGLDKPEDYLGKHPYFGVVVGRVGNRIGHGKFIFNGEEYQLDCNDGKHHLHGGFDGFDKREWTVVESIHDKIVFELYSPDGDQGYPGDVTCRVTYTLMPENTLRIDYEATTQTETLCNLTNHSYFNLCGHDAKNVYGQIMQIDSVSITDVDTDLIPTGLLTELEHSVFDFSEPKAIGEDLYAAGQVDNTGGYDHNYVLKGTESVATVYSPHTGIRMTLNTNSPGMQFYTGNFIDGTVKGKGVTYQKHSGFCLETQLFPDGINQPDFPSCIVTKGKTQSYYTEFKFSAE